MEKYINKRYIYYKGFKIYNRYKNIENHLQNIYIYSVKDYIDKNIIKLNGKINKKKICYTENMVYNTTIQGIINHK